MRYIALIATVASLLMLPGVLAAPTTDAESSLMEQESDLLTMKKCPRGKTGIYTGVGRGGGDGSCCYFEHLHGKDATCPNGGW
ncbi:unnamed protein product [Clonostachys rosea]|uniref:Uncharacterized protein n=1 Tax=Bionectria ochroleuca TaxID=29856 RepID=A0ABY6V0Y4_BIOOC|nr:unnamed protein product [Clonostachys rosea]